MLTLGKKMIPTGISGPLGAVILVITHHKKKYKQF
jgi:hypothetical protein